MHVTRRRLILASLAFSTVAVGGVSGLRAGAVWARYQDDETLAPFARRLFPHEGLPDDVYADVMGNVLRSLAADPASAEILDTVEAALDAQQDASWLDLDEAGQVAAIRKIEGEPFFAAILGALRLAFYTDRAVWRQIDYPGSSKEYGGYKGRGFDDIAWLPETES